MTGYVAFESRALIGVSQLDPPTLFFKAPAKSYPRVMSNITSLLIYLNKDFNKKEIFQGAKRI